MPTPRCMSMFPRSMAMIERVRRVLATAYRAQDRENFGVALGHGELPGSGGDSLMVTLFGEPIVVVMEEDEDVRAYRCLRRPRGAPQPVRCAVRYGMIFVNLDQRDHELIASEPLSATPRSA
ncbi:(2Fe-2S)-binding protein OS=Streptomyces microflavus OX=1919 GN=G3I39_33160 PE=4 SV=1 [Streptomyces microflavus]